MRTLLERNNIWNSDFKHLSSNVVETSEHFVASSLRRSDRKGSIAGRNRGFNDVVCLDNFHLDDLRFSIPWTDTCASLLLYPSCLLHCWMLLMHSNMLASHNFGICLTSKKISPFSMTNLLIYLEYNSAHRCAAMPYCTMP